MLKNTKECLLHRPESNKNSGITRCLKSFFPDYVEELYACDSG